MSYDKRQLEKDRETKEALDCLNLLIKLSNEQAFCRFQQLQNAQKLPKEREEKVIKFENDINHALTLLAAAKSKILEQGSSSVTDYLITSALSYLTNCLPEKSITNIVNQLNPNNVSERKDSLSDYQNFHLLLSSERPT